MFDAVQYMSDALYSDMHKEAYGFRPRNWEFADWTQADCDRELERLSEIASERWDSVETDEYAAEVEFEAMLERLQGEHGIDRFTALRWLIEGAERETDVAFYGLSTIAFDYGLRINYFADEQDLEARFRKLWSKRLQMAMQA